MTDDGVVNGDMTKLKLIMCRSLSGVCHGTLNTHVFNESMIILIDILIRNSAAFCDIFLKGFFTLAFFLNQSSEEQKKSPTTCTSKMYY